MYKVDCTSVPFLCSKHFFSVYKSLEGKETAVKEVIGKTEAISIIEKAIADYKVKFPEKTGFGD